MSNKTNDGRPAVYPTLQIYDTTASRHKSDGKCNAASRMREIETARPPVAANFQPQPSSSSAYSSTPLRGS
ncbi:hypothetical protein GWI33_004905 [Rhynchophorus ferrugineus]|uniref:Uncharacterized protein n=1 Tax=Rhynchophorus ferrugineus TaxID=354439 RepID=A0A834IK19_RHYFE|nr:hypothetical protein GWI33_004905 [Rhynchophorus ferrugineus]